MATKSFEFKVYKDVLLSIRARAAGHWDSRTSLTPSADGQKISVTMEAYDGLKYTTDTSGEYAPVIDFGETVLPWKWEYNSSLATSKYALMPAGKEYKAGARTYEGQNYSVTGNVSVTDEGIASGFGSSSYISIPAGTFTPGSADTWQIDITFTYSTSSSNQRFFGALNNSSLAQIVMGASSHKIIFWAGSNGSGWNIASGVTGSETLENGVTYHYRVAFDGSKYTCKRVTVTDGTESYSDELTIAETTTKLYNNNSVFLLGNAEQSGYCYGAIDLSAFKISQTTDGATTVYTLGKQPKLPGCTENYTDSGAETTLNAFAVNGDDSVVLTQANTHDSDRLLGTVTIPAHTVYSYNEDTETWS